MVITIKKMVRNSKSSCPNNEKDSGIIIKTISKVVIIIIKIMSIIIKIMLIIMYK